MLAASLLHAVETGAMTAIYCANAETEAEREIKHAGSSSIKHEFGISEKAV